MYSKTLLERREVPKKIHEVCLMKILLKILLWLAISGGIITGIFSRATDSSLLESFYMFLTLLRLVGIPITFGLIVGLYEYYEESGTKAQSLGIGFMIAALCFFIQCLFGGRWV